MFIETAQLSNIKEEEPEVDDDELAERRKAGSEAYDGRKERGIVPKGKAGAEKKNKQR